MPRAMRSPTRRTASVKAELEASNVRSDFKQFHTYAGLAIAVPFAATVWLFTVPHSLSAVTFAALALLTVGAVKVALDTWLNGYATGGIGQLLPANEATTLPPAKPLHDIRGL